MTPLTFERIAEIRASNGRQLQRAHGSEHVVIAGLLGHIEEQARAIERYRGALTTIHSMYGHVCEGYEVCDHQSCTSSYAAWALADHALRGEGAGDV